MELLTTFINIVAGALAGFFKSLYFWLNERKLQLPRLAIYQGNVRNYEKVNFTIQNDGYSDAENVVVKFDEHNAETFSYIKPGDSVNTETLIIFEVPKETKCKQLCSLNYQDVWGKTYQTKWLIVEGRGKDNYPEIVKEDFYLK